MDAEASDKVYMVVSGVTVWTEMF